MKRTLLSFLVLALLAGGALAQTPATGWEVFVIREGATEAPFINDASGDHGAGAIEIGTTETGQKAGLATDMINGVKISQIATLHVDRLDDIPGSGSLYGPYFNIWVTDGLGHYAVLGNEPSDAEWAGSRWDVPDWDFLKTKHCNVYETPGASGGDPGTSWIFDLTGISTGLVFEDVADLIISPPPPSYIANPANAVGSGAPDVLDTDIAYGYTWVFGDTADNYISGGDGFIVNNYFATATFPVNNVTQGIGYGTIQAAIDGANPNDAIQVDAGHYEEQLHVTINGLSISGAGVGATFIDCPPVLTLFHMTSAANYPVVLVEDAAGVAFSNLTLDGLGRGDANYRFQGFGYFNAGGSLTNIHVTNVMDTPFSGAQHGVGVYCNGDDAAPHVFNMTDVLVDAFQKTAVALNGDGVTGDLLRVTTNGAGPTPVTAQNGIQVGYGANFDVDYCDVADIDYTGENWSASGVMSVNGGVANFDHCNFDACQTSAYFSDGGGSFDNSTVVNPTGDALYAYSAGAKAMRGETRLPAQPFDGEQRQGGNKMAITVSINGSTFIGTGAADSWGPTAYGYGPVNFTINNSTVTNWDWGVVLYDFGGLELTASGADNDLSGNTSFGAYSNATTFADLSNNDWGDTSGPYHPSKNPNGLGDTVSDNIIFVPWIGRTVTLVADLGIDPTSKTLGVDGYGYYEGTLPLAVDDDYAMSFDPGAFQANVTAADPEKYTKYGFLPLVIFGRDVYVGELHSITYHTKIGTDHDVDPEDWFAQIYTNGTANGWYGERIHAEPYFSENLTETPGTWTQWVTEAGQPNRLRFYDGNVDFGGYDDGFLQDMTNDPFFADQSMMIFSLGTGTAWAEGFQGRLDGLTVELVSGEKVTLNFISGNTFIDAVPATSGPSACGDSVTLTFNLTTDDYTPDVFGFNAVVRASSEVTFGRIASLSPFGATTYFYATDLGDGSWDISATTLGNPSQPINTAGTHGLFMIKFVPVADGTADITYDLLKVRDPNNAPIPVVGTGAMIEVDCTEPAEVTGIVALPRHNKVKVDWSHDDFDVASYAIYRGLWHNGTVGTSAYPEYDDVAPATPTYRPGNVAAAELDSEWVLAGSVATGIHTFEDHLDFDPDGADRGVYYYEVFAVDAATNSSVGAAANDRATNYWLGDVLGHGGNPIPNGLVQPYDMDVLGTAFGECEGGGGPYNPVADVGPTDDWSRLGIPTTDNCINFEDLMVFSMNFGVVSDTRKAMPISSVVDLAWVRYDDGRQALRLVGGAGVKGLHIRADVRVTGVVAGDLLDAQSELTFLRNVGESLDVSVAVMGVNVGFAGSGDLFILDSESEIDVEDLTIKVRGHDNSKLEFKMGEAVGGSLTPRVFALNPNYPNPFNPMTKISFSLPEAQDVRLEVYGIDGRKVATLLNETRGPGLHEVIWNGLDDTGRQAASGMYFYRIDAGPYSQVRKMTLMK